MGLEKLETGGAPRSEGGAPIDVGHHCFGEVLARASGDGVRADRLLDPTWMVQLSTVIWVGCTVIRPPRVCRTVAGGMAPASSAWRTSGMPTSKSRPSAQPTASRY
jgi:hypothetical protein